VTVGAADASLAAAPATAVFTLGLVNVPEFSGREYALAPSGQTVVDITPRTGSRQVIVRGGGTLVLAGANAHTGGVMVEDGTLVVRNASALGSGTLDVRSGGVVRIDLPYAKASVGSLSLASDARIDLGTGGLQIAAGGTTLDALKAWVITARNGGFWNGNGIGSANASRILGYEIGYRQMLTGSYQVAWAAVGDTNLNGKVDSTDINAIISARKFSLPTASTTYWAMGDFTYDGRVNSSDIQRLASMFGKPSYYAAAGAAAQPQSDTTKPLTAKLFANFGQSNSSGT
jgi:autotransporter-associated beta strand protein